MKLMQKQDYNMAKKIDLEIQQLDDDEAPRTPGTIWVNLVIMKTCPCNVYPLEPHLYIAKLGYAGVYLFLLQNIDCGYSLEPPRRGESNM